MNRSVCGVDGHSCSATATATATAAADQEGNAAGCSRFLSAAGHRVSRVSEIESSGIAAVPSHVLDELADVLIDRLDQLLDRLTDRALAAPTAGSAVWESEWNDRDTDAGRARARERSRVRAELARRAGAGLGMVDPPPSLPQQLPHTPVGRMRRARPVRHRVDEGQLAFF